MLERALINHAAPTLARLKLGSMFNVSRNEGDFDGELARLNDLFAPKGVVLTVLREREGRALMYLYRANELERALSSADIQSFLSGCGYGNFDVETVLQLLRKRIGESEEFPHEIGVFLGYPLSDVVDFIANAGQNSICSGCWKVYSNECAALRTFAQFRKCKEVYGRLFSEGCPLARLTVRSRTA